MTECRYALLRLVPDPIRDEPVNVGVVVQSDIGIECLFVRKLARAVYTDSDLVAGVFQGLEDEWKARLAEPSAVIMDSDGRSVSVPLTDPRYLDWLRRTHVRHVQLSDIRIADVPVDSKFAFEGLVVHLFDRFVRYRPLAKRVVARPGARLHTKLRHDFKPLLDENKMVEGGVVEGTILWEVDFTYRNGSQVAIAAADFNLKSVVENTQHIFAAWSDIQDTKRDEVKRVTVLGNYQTTGEFTKLRRLIERVSSRVYHYEGDRNSLVSSVYSELEDVEVATKDPDLPRLGLPE